MIEEDKEPGQQAYEDSVATDDGVGWLTGLPRSTWAKLPENIKQLWSRRHSVSVAPASDAKSNGDAFAQFLKDGAEECKKHHTCMSFFVNEEGQCVELILDTAVSTYTKWIPGERGDVGLLLCQKTDRVVGCTLPLMNRKLVVHYEGPLRINCGFRKQDDEKGIPGATP